MIVELRREAGEHAGSLALRVDDVPSDARQLRAASCAEVAEALAVVAAIALRGDDDPTVAGAPTTSAPRADAPAAAPAATAPPVSPPGNHVVDRASAQTAPPADTHLKVAGVWGTEPISVSEGQLQVRRNLVATLSGGVVLGAIPGVVLPRYDLSLSRTNFITTPRGSSFIIGNVVGVRWSFFGPSTQRSGDFTTDIGGFKAGVTACASLSYDTSGFVALLCSGFSVGLMRLSTRDLASDYRKSKDVGLGAATLELDARYNIGKYFHVGLLLGGEFWVSRLTAERADGSEIFRSRLFNANAQLGLGLHF